MRMPIRTISWPGSCKLTCPQTYILSSHRILRKGLMGSYNVLLLHLYLIAHTCLRKLEVRPCMVATMDEGSGDSAPPLP